MSEVIKLLPDAIANQIAAGEVIQRPASVIKELVENAVDAGATKIEVIIKDAGRTLIQVIDNGKGMTEMDARMCWERHATSKLQSADDLFNLRTKGFRGEALASIAAIAHVEMETRHESREIGCLISIAASKVENQEPIIRPIGTSISVKNLFFNVPARRNFLKGDNVENKHVNEEFIRVALVHPEITFKLTHNGSVVYDLPAGILRKRIVDIFGKNFNDKLVPIEEDTDLVRIKGFVGKPEFVRKTRGEQYFFVNNRFFKDSYFHHAVSAAYDNLIPSKTYPAYFIYFEVPTQSIDVNIHPTKTEIKFEEDRNIYSILRSTIKLALGKYSIAPTIDFEVETQFDVPPLAPNQIIRQPEIQIDRTYNPFEEERKQKEARQSGGGGFGASAGSRLQPNRSDWENYFEIAKEEEEATAQLYENNAEEEIHGSSLFILHGKYILSQVKSGLLAIHINRARERVLYDQLMEQFMVSPIGSQQLMFPIEQKFRAEEKLEWENNITSLKRLGFEWVWNRDMLVLEGIPSHLNADNLKECLDEIIEKITHRELDKGELAHELIVSLSKAASGSRDKSISKEVAEELVNQLFACEEHQFCPKGKRIIQTISIDEINKKFI
jgi:DNA mismatch repair protein MutL